MVQKPSWSDFQFVLLGGRDLRPQARPFVEPAYQLWHEVWSEALRELEGASDLPSDDFTRHEQQGVLWYRDEPIGSVSFTPADLSMTMWRSDSYFRAWPRDVLDEVAERYVNQQILIGCYFTLRKEWRRDSQGFSAKRLLMALAVEHMLDSPCAMMTGTMRKNRGMHTICYELFASPLASGVIHHGVEVDLLVFDKQTILQARQSAVSPFLHEAKEIYARKIDLDERTNFAILEKKTA